MRKVDGKHPFCVLIYMNTYIFHICFILFILLSIFSLGTMSIAKNCWRLGWSFFARTMATQLY